MSLMKNFRKYFYDVDLFGTSISLLQKDRQTYNTLFGSFISLGIIMFTGASFISMILDMLARQSPNIVSKIEYTPNPEAFELTPNNFFLGVGLGDKDGQPLMNQPNRTFYRAEASFCTQKIDSNNPDTKLELKCINYTMDYCNKMNISENFKKQNNNTKQYEVFYCLNDTQWNKDPIILEGSVSSSIYRLLYIYLKICVNTTEDQTCAPKEKLEEIMTGGYAVYVISDKLLDQMKEGNPYVSISKQVITTFSKKSLKYVSVYMRHSITETIENFFYYLPNKFLNHELQYEYQDESQSPINEDTKTIFELNLFLDDKKSYYFRTYNNIFNILGDIGGLFGTITFLANLILAPLTKFRQNLFLANEIFAFEIENQKVFPLQKKMTMKHVIDLIRFREVENQSQKEVKQNLGLELRRFLSQKEKKLTFKGMEIITLLCKGPRKKQVEWSAKKIQQKLNISFIIRKLIEIEKLKMVLMTPEQTKLFEYIPRPTIPVNNQDNFDSIYFQDEKSYEKRVVAALESYKILSKQNPIDSITSRLLQQIDSEIKDVFEQALGNNYLVTFLDESVLQAQDLDQRGSRLNDVQGEEVILIN